MTVSQSPITVQELSAKRETACWGEVEHWRGLVSVQSETVYHRSFRDVVLTPNGYEVKDRSHWPVRLTAELTCEEKAFTDGEHFRVMIRHETLFLSGPGKGQSEILWLESPKFPTLSDSQRYADWAITVWHQQGTFTAAGCRIRWDLDRKGNPTC